MSAPAAVPASTRLFPPLPPPPPTVRRLRPGAALALAAVVLWLHGGLMVALAPVRPVRWGVATQGPPRATAVQVLAPARAPAPAAAPVDAATRPAPPLAQAMAVPAASPPPGAVPSPAVPGPPAAAAAPTAPTASTATTATTATTAPAVPATLVADTAPAAVDGSVEPVERSSGGAEAPPVYATRIPPPVQLRYALRYNGRSGVATLTWRHDGLRYQLALDGQGGGEALVVQASQGGFDRAGLAPERFTDRRRGGRLQAANFRRDIGRIAFSGPAVDYPAWPGAQDRLSWLPQLVAIRAAASAPTAGSPASAPTAGSPASAPTAGGPVSASPAGAAGAAGAAERATTSLFVVDARGAAAVWHFQPEGDVLLATPLGPLATEHWRREPPRPEGLRVDAWLDAARGHWPVQLRFTALRSGDVFELLLLAEPQGAP